jgi:hypothetical protein
VQGRWRLPFETDSASSLTGRTCAALPADEARWQGRLAALMTYRESRKDWPRLKALIEGLEHAGIADR